MRCPNCGSETATSAVSCGSCGKPLHQLTRTQKPGPTSRQAPSVERKKEAKTDAHVARFTHADVAKKLKFDYMYGSKDTVDKTLLSLEPLFSAYRRPKTRVHDLLEEAARIIYKQLRIREVSIGIRDPKDGLFKYEIMAGMRAGVWQAHEELVYTEEDFFRNDKWRGTMISKYTKLMLAEDNPYAEGEERTFDRQEMMADKRHNLDDSIEGDYMDIMILGLNEDLLGWIEISGTWTSKVPDTQTIRLIELIACTLGSMLSNSLSPAPQK